MKRKLFASILALAMLFSMAACGSGAPTSSEGGSPDAQQTQSGGQGGSGETVSLRVWGAEEDQALLKDLVEKFKQTYSNQTFDIQIGVESESKAKDDILTDISAAADVFAFACDQLPDLVAAGALLPIDDQMDAVLQNYAKKSVADGDSSNQIKSGALCAIVSGCWDSQVAAETFGDDYMACRLPSFTAGGKYWDPVKSFGEQIAQGAIKDDDASVQAALDDLVAGVTP